MIILCSCILLTAGLPAHAVPPEDALHAAHAKAVQYNQPIQNAVYLYLRIAGVIWLGVEWFAAVILFRLHRHLRIMAREAGMTNP